MYPSKTDQALGVLFLPKNYPIIRTIASYVL